MITYPISSNFCKKRFSGILSALQFSIFLVSSFMALQFLIFLASSFIEGRSSHPEVFCEKGVLENFAKFTGKHFFHGLFFNKVAGLRAATL